MSESKAMSESGRWVNVKPATGGQVVTCRLCGKSFTRTFWASDTNYAEALRLAIAHASIHQMSEEHAAAMKAFFHGDPPKPSAQEKQMDEIFGHQPKSQHQLRRDAARNAAISVSRERRRVENQKRSLAGAERHRAETQQSPPPPL